MLGTGAHLPRRRVTRMTAGVVSFLVCAATAAAPVAQATARATVSGSPAGIKLARAEAHAFTTVQTISISENGAVLSSSGRDSGFDADWYWASPQPSPGEQRASLTGTLELRHGRLVWSELQLTPVCGASCGGGAAVVLTAASGTYVASGTLRRHGCFLLAHGPFLADGSLVSAAYGRYSEPVRRGSEIALTGRYGLSLTDNLAYDARYTIIETDTLDAATDLPSRILLQYSTLRGPDFSIRQRLGFSRARPFPSLVRCTA